MTILVKKNNQWLPIKNIYAKNDSLWKTIKHGYIKQSGIWRQFWQNSIIFINDTPQTSINIFELMGSPTKGGNYIFINNAEIIASNNKTAVTTGVFSQDSTLSIINNSYIIGYGGNGGTRDSNGQDGGTAIQIEMPCHIDNACGYIYGGGGGGGGISVSTNTLNIYRNYYMGGAGGTPNGEVAEIFSRTSTGYYDQYDYNNPENQSGGHVTTKLYAANTSLLFRTVEFITGDGGAYGEIGKPSQLTVNVPPNNAQYNTITVKTYEGGNPGLAINKNNFDVIIISDSERIKGEIL